MKSNSKHSECIKRSGQELEKGQDEKELKSKRAAKAGSVSTSADKGFNNHNSGHKTLTA